MGVMMNLDYLLEQSTISKGEALKYFREIVRGLDHIHGKKIIHGDLSRKNIFIDASNVIKVADFGLETGAPIDEKIDIYSLGILLLELLGSFTTMFERAHAITNLRQMRVLPESVRGYEDYILQLVALSPGERPSTREILTWPICADVSSSEADDDDRVPIRTEDEPGAADDDPPQKGDADVSDMEDDDVPEVGDTGEQVCEVFRRLTCVF
ncbi:hypothetical protein OIU85_006859 [Salix viminalis]|uniref:Protein kinase domain-containing protein n=1 Tax=Salix viminalis TaxID=40686 RepID=A0A9Q0SVI6_SALVM|nr:hypothetical protein OIU85_006859 [Salix viminalis]